MGDHWVDQIPLIRAALLILDKAVDEPSLSTVTGVRGHSNVCMQLCKYVSKYVRCTGDTIILARQEHDVCVCKRKKYKSVQYCHK